MTIPFSKEDYPAGLQLENVGCPCGSSNGDEQLFEGGDILMGIPGRFWVVKCRSCELIRTNPRPTPDTIGSYYPDDYGPYAQTKIADDANSTMGQMRKVFKKFLPTYSMHIPSGAAGRMLEIGCASGAYLSKMKKEGWDVDGIEFSPIAAASARSVGLNVHAGSVEGAPNPKNQYDLIVGWMVVEHLHDPVAALKKLASWSKSTGRLVISVPNASSVDFRFNAAGFGLHLPNHLYHFTPESLSALLTQTGWEIERVYHQRTLSNLIGSIGYWLKQRNFAPWIYKPFLNFPGSSGLATLLMYPIAALFAFCKQTGRMTVWARKSQTQ